MKLDAMRRHSRDDVVDAVVIGTGAGAAPLLAALAEAGLSVVALEAGRNWNPASFTADEVQAAELYWLGERLSAGQTPEAFGANNSGTGVGGSTLHWGAYTPRPDPRDLRIRSEFGVGCDWPLDHSELLAFLERAERDIGVSGPEHYLWDPQRRYEFAPLPLNAPAQMMQTGCAAIGLRSCAAPIAALSRAQAERQACIACGYCHQGCRIGAKASMDVTYLPAAVRAGAEIRPECLVHDLQRDQAGRIVSVSYRNHGTDFRQKCAAVFLCAGAIETPRLLLHLGLANSSGQVGRNYMAHVATQVWGTFEPEMRPNKGFPASLITEDMIRPQGADFAGGYLLQSLGIVPVTWAAQVARGRGLFGQPLVDAIDGYNHTAGIGMNGDCLPQADNFLELSDETDETGLRKPRVQFSYGDNERAMSRHAEACMTAIWQAAGARDIWTFQRAAHTIGTCRMGSDGDRNVVDPFGRSFDVGNLWICDNSVFPSALPANPALTIMALSLRTAAAFLAE